MHHSRKPQPAYEGSFIELDVFYFAAEGLVTPFSS
jgi:hypothetical protein